MRRKGWVRLWIVATVIFVPSIAIWAYIDDEATWSDIERPMITMCVDQETNLPSHPDGLACLHKEGVDQTVFQHEHISPGSYWARGFGVAFALDLVLTGLLVGAFLVVRWIVRGFRAESSTAHH